jgi:hypothetical protein
MLGDSPKQAGCARRILVFSGLIAFRWDACGEQWSPDEAEVTAIRNDAFGEARAQRGG